jgi:hypothetical protein
VALEADESRCEGEDHQSGHGHQQGRDDHTADESHSDAALGRRVCGRAGTPEPADRGGRGHWVFLASHVNVALDCLLCAPLSSLTA